MEVSDTVRIIICAVTLFLRKVLRVFRLFIFFILRFSKITSIFSLFVRSIAFASSFVSAIILELGLSFSNWRISRRISGWLFIIIIWKGVVLGIVVFWGFIRIIMFERSVGNVIRRVNVILFYVWICSENYNFVVRFGIIFIIKTEFCISFLLRKIIKKLIIIFVYFFK